MDNENTIRLAKRVAEMRPCSRREAELYIEGGFVSVDGTVVEEPGARVAEGQQIVIAADATLLEIKPVTILLNKPAGMNAGIGHEGLPALTVIHAESQAPAAPPVREQRFLKRDAANQKLATPLETMASGLVVYTQDFRVARKLIDDAAQVEHEIIAEVSGTIAENGLALLCHGLSFKGKALPPIKVSWQNETRLRFALKDPKWGQIENMCQQVGLKVVAMKRIRIGRVSMASLPVGQWRYLQGFERF
jgi:23S rRNA pseudouridine2604 synthase